MAAAFGLAACSGVPNAISPSTAALAKGVSQRSTMRYDSKHDLIFVVNAGNVIQVYDPNLNDPSPIAEITEGVTTPEGICMDKSGTLYVTEGTHNRLPEYLKGHSAPYQVITTGLEYPGDCAVDGAGNLWVTNVNGPNVTEYPQGSLTPSTVITKGISYPIALAFDPKGDMFVTNRLSKTNNVQVYPPGALQPSMTITDGITSPGGVAVDATGTLYVANAPSGTIPEYKAGQYSPFQTITSGTDYPGGLTVNRKGTLFVANFSGNNIAEYSLGSLYPSKKSISRSINQPGSTAYSPPLLPKARSAEVSRESTSKSDLLYVTDNGNGSIYVYTYPQGKTVQQLQYGFPPSAAGDCVDDFGNVFVSEYNVHKILVYAHGASVPKRVLRDPGLPIGCSIDPTTGNLAVANAESLAFGPGNVAIWKNPLTSTGNGPTFVYSELPFAGPAWCAYDDKGNLIVDGENYSQHSVSLAELSAGASSFESISLNLYLGWPAGSVQWDGKYITISVGNAIYQLSISGSTAYVVGSTLLPLNWTLQGYAIAGSKLIATSGGDVGVFQYPSGKGPTKTLSQNEPFAPVLSSAR